MNKIHIKHSELQAPPVSVTCIFSKSCKCNFWWLIYSCSHCRGYFERNKIKHEYRRRHQAGSLYVGGKCKVIRTLMWGSFRLLGVKSITRLYIAPCRTDIVRQHDLTRFLIKAGKRRELLNIIILPEPWWNLAWDNTDVMHCNREHWKFKPFKKHINLYL